MFHPNELIFKKGPTKKQIQRAVLKSGMSQARFERYHGIYNTGISQALTGVRSLPAKYWHLFKKPGKPSSKVLSKRSTNPIFTTTKINHVKNKESKEPKLSEKLTSLLSGLFCEANS